MEVEEILQKLQRDINCLSDSNKTTRRRALERLRRETIGHKPFHPSHAIAALFDALLKPLLMLFSDPMEKCRDLSIETVLDFMLSDAVTPTQSLPLLMPVVVARLGTPEITESSEEIRLALIKLMLVVVKRCRGDIQPYLTDMVTILRQTIVDPYPEIKKESCICTSELAEAIPAVFHQQSESLAKPLLVSMTHQHSKVRTAALKAFGMIIQFGSATPINDALPSLAQRSCDSNPLVRSCLISVAGSWLLDLPDRYSYFHKLIPLLLTGFSDEVPDIRHTAHDLWEKVGSQYQLENEKNLKDKMDFAQCVEPAPGLEYGRPGLGCRVLVYQNFSKILPAILRDITDWTVNSRIKSSQLLSTLLYHLEEDATHHIQALLAGLYRASQDEETSVIEQVIRSSELIGYYIPPEVWSHLVLPAVRVSAGCRVTSISQKGGGSTVPVGPVQCGGCLMVLSALIRGAKRDAIQQHLLTITQCIAEPEVAQSESLNLLRQLLSCVASVTMATNPAPDLPHSRNLFEVLLRVLASSQAGLLAKEIEREMVRLANVQELPDKQHLYDIHALAVIDSLQPGYESWSIHSPNCGLFHSLLAGVGPVIGQLISKVLPILHHCTQPGQDPEMRLRFITVLIQLILRVSEGKDQMGVVMHPFLDCSGELVKEIFMPCAVWRPGRTAAAIRTAAMTGVQVLLQACLIPENELQSLLPDLLPQVVSCMDDDNQSTRLVSCCVQSLLFQSSPKLFKVDQLHNMYPELIKRLDDNSDEIRLEITRTLVAYVSAFPQSYDRELYSAHTEALYKALLIHLDDPMACVQEAMLSVLKTAAALNPPLLRQLVGDVKHRHRTPRYCDELMAAIPC